MMFRDDGSSPGKSVRQISRFRFQAPSFFAAIWAASWAMALPGVCEDLASLLGETNRGLLSKAGWFFHVII